MQNNQRPHADHPPGKYRGWLGTWLQRNYLTVILTVLIGALIGYCLADWMGWIR